MTVMTTPSNRRRKTTLSQKSGTLIVKSKVSSTCLSWTRLRSWRLVTKLCKQRKMTSIVAKTFLSSIRRKLTWMMTIQMWILLLRRRCSRERVKRWRSILMAGRRSTTKWTKTQTLPSWFCLKMMSPTYHLKTKRTSNLKRSWTSTSKSMDTKT